MDTLIQPVQSPNRHHRFGDELKIELLQTTKGLPPMPQILVRVREMVGKSRAGLRDLASVLETDSAITLRILQLTNSAYYRRRQAVTCIQQACLILGEQALLSLLTIVTLERMVCRHLRGYDISAKAMYEHSLATAYGCRFIAEQRHPGLALDAFTVGLVHDIGKVILDPYVEQRRPAFRLALRCGETQTAEQVVLGLDHAEMGASFCQHWKMVENQTLAVRYHHNPAQAPAEAKRLSYMIHVANFIAHASGFGTHTDEATASLTDEALEYLSLSTTDIAALQREITDAVERTAIEMLGSEGQSGAKSL